MQVPSEHFHSPRNLQGCCYQRSISIQPCFCVQHFYLPCTPILAASLVDGLCFLLYRNLWMLFLQWLGSLICILLLTPKHEGYVPPEVLSVRNSLSRLVLWQSYFSRLKLRECHWHPVMRKSLTDSRKDCMHTN